MKDKSGRLSKAENEKLSHDLMGALDAAYMRASVFISNPIGNKWNLFGRFINALEKISANSNSASTGFTNIVTCLSIKVVRKNIDVRVYKVEMGALFNFRTKSE